MTDNATDVTMRKVRDVVIVGLPARLAAETEEAFNEKVEWALADTPGRIILDVSAVQSADAAGVKALDFLFYRTEEVDIPVTISAVGDTVKPLLDSAGYLARADMAASVDAALEADLA